MSELVSLSCFDPASGLCSCRGQVHVWVLLKDLFGLLGYFVALSLCDVKFAHVYVYVYLGAGPGPGPGPGPGETPPI